MQIFQDLSEIISNHPTVVTVGTFDGVHLGHEQLIQSTVEYAQRKGVGSALVTFFPHPRVVLGRAEPFYLTSNAEKFARLERLGLDWVVVVKFTTEVAQYDLRDLTRYRSNFVRERTNLVNRLQKTLDGANIKLASNVVGISGRAKPCSAPEGHGQA